MSLLFSNRGKSVMEDVPLNSNAPLENKAGLDPEAFDQLRNFTSQHGIELVFGASFQNKSFEDKNVLVTNALKYLQGLSSEELGKLKQVRKYIVSSKYGVTSSVSNTSNPASEITRLLDEKGKQAGINSSNNVSPRDWELAQARAARIKAKQGQTQTSGEELTFTPKDSDGNSLSNLANHVDGVEPDKAEKEPEIPTAPPLPPEEPPNPPRLGGSGEDDDTETDPKVGLLDKWQAKLKNAVEVYKGVEINVSFDVEDPSLEILNNTKNTIREILDGLSEKELKTLKSYEVSISIINSGGTLSFDGHSKLSVPLGSDVQAIRDVLRNSVLSFLLPETTELKLQQEPEPKVESEPDVPLTPPAVESKNWRDAVNWLDLENKRRAYAEAQVKFSRSEGEEEENANVQILKVAETEYDAARNAAEVVIRESLKDKSETEIEGVLVEELLEKENHEFLEAQRKAQGEILKDKAKEALMTVIKTKGVQWYLRLPKTTRMICNFAVGGLAGLVTGSITAPTAAAGYLAWRGARIFGGGALGTAAGEAAAEKWSIEDLNKKEAEEIAVLQNDPNLSKEEKFYGFGEIKERYRRERLKYSAIRTGASVVAGAGAGLYMGLMENIANGSGIPEITGSRVGNIQDRLPRRSGFQPEDQTLKPSPVVDRMASRSTPEPAPAVPVAEVSEVGVEPDLPARPDVAEVVATTPTSPNEIFSDPSVLKHVPQKGDTLWNEVKETLKHNDRFKNFSGTPKEIEAKQTFVTNGYINYIAQDPDSMAYGVGKGGDIFVGREVDLTKVFEDTKRFDTIMKDAENLSQAKVKVIVNYNRQIEQYVTKHPEVKLTPENVSEILEEKLETPIVPKVEPPPQIPVTEDPIREEAVKTLDKIESTPLPENVAKGLALGTVAGVGAQMLKNNLDAAAREEIRVAKERLGILEGDRNSTAPKMEIRTMSGDMEVVQNRLTDEQIESAMRTGLNDFFGKPGGILSRKKEGMDSDEWKTIRNLPFLQVQKLFSKDPGKLTLNPDILSKLNSSDKYVKFVEHMNDHLDYATEFGVAFSFNNTDTVEDALRRIIVKLDEIDKRQMEDATNKEVNLKQAT